MEKRRESEEKTSVVVEKSGISCRKIVKIPVIKAKLETVPPNTLNAESALHPEKRELNLKGMDKTESSTLVNLGEIFCFAVKTVLGGESLRTTSVTKIASVSMDMADISTPDEADIGTLGLVVEKAGPKSCEASKSS